jgi:hypothetical protein
VGSARIARSLVVILNAKIGYLAVEIDRLEGMKRMGADLYKITNPIDSNIRFVLSLTP